MDLFLKRKLISCGFVNQSVNLIYEKNTSQNVVNYEKHFNINNKIKLIIRVDNVKLSFQFL